MASIGGGSSDAFERRHVAAGGQAGFVDRVRSPTRPPSEVMMRFIDTHRVEPICDVLPIAPSLYYERRARQHNAERWPPRVRRDERRSRQIQRAWHEEHWSTAPGRC